MFGTGALAGTTIAVVKDWYPRQRIESSSGGCGSVCGDGDGGGVGCGGRD